MKKYILIIFFILLRFVVSACDVCKKQQPTLLQNITHGSGPESKWDYVIIWGAVIIVLFTLFYSIKWLIRPGETSGSHIKRFILNNNE